MRDVPQMQWKPDGMSRLSSAVAQQSEFGDARGIDNVGNDGSTVAGGRGAIEIGLLICEGVTGGNSVCMPHQPFQPVYLPQSADSWW
jgi:hypothetical protein